MKSIFTAQLEILNRNKYFYGLIFVILLYYSFSLRSVLIYIILLYIISLSAFLTTYLIFGFPKGEKISDFAKDRSNYLPRLPF